MPYQPLVFQPGINRKATAYNNEGAWFAAEKVRFQDGRPQPIGGWDQEPLIGELLGVCRTKLTWRMNNGAILEAFGTSEGLWVNSDGTLYDITPPRKSYLSETDPLTTTSGSTDLLISASSHNAQAGDRVEVSGFDLTGQGLPMEAVNKTHSVVEVVDNATVRVELTVPATSTAADVGGTGAIIFLQSPGAEGTVYGQGYGAGSYGVGTYGTPRSTIVQASRARVWSLDTWGEILVGTYRNGVPVKWDPSNDGLNVRASEISNAPAADALVVSSPDRHLVLLGSVLPGESTINRLCVRWCDQEDFTQWNITATTTAGYQLISTGSEILAGRQAARQVMIWTDTTLTAMQYIGPPYIFGFQPLDYTPAIVSRNSVVEVDGMVMWMSLNSFYVFDGIARALPCPIKDVVFDIMNTDQAEKFFGVINQEFHEVWWFYVSQDAVEIDRYVIFDYVAGLWSYGSMSRTAWEDSGIYTFPTAIDNTNTYYLHERGLNANGRPLLSFVESAPFDIGEGDNMMFVKGLVPDARMTGPGTMEVLLKGRRYPQGVETKYGPYTIDRKTERVRTRLRVRQVVFRYEGTDKDVFWQGGKPRIDLKPQGEY